MAIIPEGMQFIGISPDIVLQEKKSSQVNEKSEPYTMTDIIDTVSAGIVTGADWGSITGILSNQTDLQSALDSKVSGTGTTNYVSKWTGADTQGNSLIFDNGTNVGIGTATPATTLDVVGAISLNDGNKNTKVGTNAGANYGGFNQSAFGNYAGFGNAGASQSVFGLNAGRSNTGDNQSAVGYNAGQNNIGNVQSAFGRSAGENNTGFGQSVFGYLAGRGNTGDNNSNFGKESGYLLSDGISINTSSSDSVFLGSSTKALGASQTNQIVIGHNAIGAGSNTATLGNDSITKTILRGNVSTNGSVQVGDDVSTASAANVGAIRYRTDVLGSYADMAMETASGVYAWVNIVTNLF